MSALPKTDPKQNPVDVPSDEEVRIVADIFASRFIARLDAKGRENALWEYKTGGPKGPDGGSPEIELAKLRHNERTKLSANLLNALSVAFCVGSGVTTFSNAADFATNWQKIGSALIWLVFGAIFHALARNYLGRLK